MRINKKIGIFLAGFLLIGILVTVGFPKEESKNKDAVFRIGSGDDVSGLLMQETTAELAGKYAVSENLESTSFQDC